MIAHRPTQQSIGRATSGAPVTFHVSRLHMDAWQTILLAFGGNAALLAVLGVLGKSYVMACIPEIETDTLRLEVLKPGIVIDMDGLRGVNVVETQKVEET